MRVARSLGNLFFRVRHGFRGAPMACLDRGFRVDESLRRWRNEGEEPVLLTLREHLRTGDTLIDVGANFGLHTMWGASCVGENGRVIAIEPVPANLALLRRNLALNSLSHRVSVIDKAASDVADVEVVLHGVQDGVSVAAGMQSTGVSGAAITVRTTTLDQCLAETRAIGLIKIDVEGAEHKVILGAKKVLDRLRPLLLIEVHEFALEHFGTSVQQLRHDLAQLGYTEKIIDVVQGEMGRYFHALYRPS